MALSRPTVANEPGLVILKDSPDYFAGVLCKLRVCHDLCVYSDVPILGDEVKLKLEECSVNFRHVSTQTARLAERIASCWCTSCLVFFSNLEKIKADPSRVLTKISCQAQDLSKGFEKIAAWVRALAGKFHDCQQLSEKDKEVYMKDVSEALQKAENANKCAANARDKARQQRESAQSSADKWSIAACIPFVNIVALPGYVIADGRAWDARVAEAEAIQQRDQAQQSLKEATSAEQRAKIAAKHIKELIEILGQVEHICEAQAGFWNYQADKFGSFAVQVKDASDFIDLGIVDSVEELTTWLKDRKRDLEAYHEVMSGINSSFNFPTKVKPQSFPAIKLPSLDIVLE